jgi:hypothetical protein
VRRGSRITGSIAGLAINFGRLGARWFAERFEQDHIELLLHEYAHEAVSDHLSSEFHDEIARLGAKLALYLVKRPLFLIWARQNDK